MSRTGRVENKRRRDVSQRTFAQGGGGPRLIWDVQRNQNGGVYHNGMPHDPAFRQIVAEHFLYTIGTTRADTARHFQKSPAFVSKVVHDMLNYDTLMTFDYGGDNGHRALQFEDMA